MVNLTRESIAQEFYKSKKAEDGHAIYMPYKKRGLAPLFILHSHHSNFECKTLYEL